MFPFDFCDQCCYEHGYTSTRTPDLILAGAYLKVELLDHIEILCLTF